MFDYSSQPRQHPPPLDLPSLLYRTESMVLSMRKMELQRAERARGRAAARKSTVEEISLATDRCDYLTVRVVQ